MFDKLIFLCYNYYTVKEKYNMIDVLHIELTDEELVALKEGQSIDLDFDKGELNNIMQIVIKRGREE